MNKMNNILNIKNYNVLELINTGAFGALYLGENKRTGEKVAIKVEKTEAGSIKHETQMLQYLYEKGVRSIPPIYWYGMANTTHKYPVVVLPYYNCNLAQYIQHTYLSAEQLGTLMCKMIQIMEEIHREFVIHRDIKPQNFMVKGANIYLIDFGLSTFFIDGDVGEHVKDVSSNSMIGTPRYASVNIHRGHRYSRRDDLISLGYMYVWLMGKGKCPWEPTPEDIQYVFSLCNAEENQNANANAIMRINDKINIRHERNLAMLMNKEYWVFLHRCLLGSDHPITQYLHYAYVLDFSAVPDYNKLRGFFIE